MLIKLQESLSENLQAYLAAYFAKNNISQSFTMEIHEGDNSCRLDLVFTEGPLEGEGKPERLKHKEGEYSRRIDSENRLVYEFSEETITVKACRGHHEE